MSIEERAAAREDEKTRNVRAEVLRKAAAREDEKTRNVRAEVLRRSTEIFRIRNCNPNLAKRSH